MNNSICDKCETVSHCSKKGCIPVTAAPPPAVEQEVATLIEELDAAAARLTQYTNSPLDGLLNAAARMIESLATTQPTSELGTPSPWSGWACQYPGKLPRLYGAREIAEVNCDHENGDRLFFLASTHPSAAKAEEVPVELWRGERKVTIYKDSVLRSWGVNIETEMSDAPRSANAVQAAIDWLHPAPSAAGAAEQAVAGSRRDWEKVQGFAQKIVTLMDKEECALSSVSGYVHDAGERAGWIERIAREALAAPGAALAAREQEGKS